MQIKRTADYIPSSTPDHVYIVAIPNPKPGEEYIIGPSISAQQKQAIVAALTDSLSSATSYNPQADQATINSDLGRIAP